MKLHRTLLSVLALALVATTALAFELTVRADPDNLVASRLTGVWKLEPTLTARLDADTATKSLAQLSFKNDPSVLTRLQGVSDRFASEQIFAAGLLEIDGKSRPYVLSNKNGNMRVTWFTMTEDQKPGRHAEALIQIAAGRDPSKDLLMLGGESARQPFAVYERASR